MTDPTMMGRSARAALVAVALAAMGSTALAQSIASRVAGVRDGTVRFEYPAREGVCGNGRGNISVRTGTGTMRHGTYSRVDGEWEDECEPGPVRVALDVARGEVTDVRAYVGGRWRGDAELDLGTVSATDASDFLLGLAARADAQPAKEAIFPATIAEGVTVWPQLLRIAKDTDRPRDVRNGAIFWVSQAAGEAATQGLQEIIDDPSGDREVRKSAVFSISQRPKDESVPALIRIAKAHKDPEIRRTAIFWLGQSRDPRALAYFEEVLLPSR